MELLEKLRILGDAAKYDAACTSSGVNRAGTKDGIGNTVGCGLCHSFAADGRCISLLKVLLTNYCVNDCKYCINRISNDVERAAFTPREIADLTINFYKRNYIEGLFLSSGIVKNADYTMELLCEAISILRNEYRFNGYIHAKAIPGASEFLVTKLGLLVDRMSVNIELPSESSLKLLAPQKSKENITKPMGLIQQKITQSKNELALFRHAQQFAPSGQATQMIIGATPDTDFQIMRLSDSLYKKFKLKRVFYSAYVPVGSSPNLPALDTPPLLREHRLYQADWLLRFYEFDVGELLDEKNSNFNPLLDPKCDWALRHLDQFPVEVNTADVHTLLRVPGIGPGGAKKIVAARRVKKLDFDDLKKLRIVLKRAQYFILCKGRYRTQLKFSHDTIYKCLISEKGGTPNFNEQLCIFDEQKFLPGMEDGRKCLTGQL